ncbi:hypothetical protein [Gordonia sp. OPL2]|uniref:hypothetical protein n=1 Tax=Gordonia sp. OPL2 TaxID=2486274 RepID=UPI00165645C3|nr:hypothetical protein [Gordonia sp. OPL2]RPA12081.1 hypothetical protein EEB19_07020 [Gordonia sp. OPL2]
MRTEQDDSDHAQAIVFVAEFERIADVLVADLENPRTPSKQLAGLRDELYQVRAQIRRLEDAYGLRASVRERG